MGEFPLFLIPLVPLVSAAVLLVLGRRMGKDATALIACGSVGASFLLTLKGVLLLREQSVAITDTFFSQPWLKAGELTLSAGLSFDHLSSVLCLIITGIGLLIHIYATAYMEPDDAFARFFGYLNLFTGAMLILVLGDSLPVTFVGWEGVGLCSYLL